MILTIKDKYKKLARYYNDFDEMLLDPMLTTAIHYPDPSFNMIFLNPCTKRFGYKRVLGILGEKFISGDIVCKIGVANLFYHVRPDDRTSLEAWIDEIRKRCNETDSLVERYHYKLCVKSLDKEGTIPNNAYGLIARIKGDRELEQLLFTKLGWSKP